VLEQQLEPSLRICQRPVIVTTHRPKLVP
jgi:hypothetical protein